jgi:hypothetical protein
VINLYGAIAFLNLDCSVGSCGRYVTQPFTSFLSLARESHSFEEDRGQLLQLFEDWDIRIADA